jgi:hypothetical protein
MKNTLIAALAAAFLIGPPAMAQSGKIGIKHLDKLSSKASQYAEVNLSGTVLRIAMKLATKEDPELREELKNIKGIYVRAMSFDKEGPSFSTEDIEAIKRQIVMPPWEHLVRATQKGKGGSDGDIGIYVLADPKTETLKGLVVLAAQDKQLAFVNIVGDFDPDKLDLLEGNFGVPKMGSGKKKTSKTQEQQDESE